MQKLNSVEIEKDDNIYPGLARMTYIQSPYTKRDFYIQQTCFTPRLQVTAYNGFHSLSTNNKVFPRSTKSD